MRPRLTLLAAAAVVLSLVLAGAASAQVLGDSVIHDPSRIIQDGDRYYVYATPQSFADGIVFKWSDDLVTWHDPNGNAIANAIFADAPSWVPVEKPNNDGTFWAPSVIKHGDEYRMYYSVSTIFTQESAIGYAASPTLDFRSPDYNWVDRGMVIESEIGYQYNTIDPSVFVDEDERMWMTFGSYWTGIYITELNPGTGKPYDATPAGATRIAGRAGDATDVEAPYIHYNDGYYYLFVNWGSCCSGVDSTYNIRVGRGTSPTGPFYTTDNDSFDMRDGGGRLFLGAEGDRIGPGHAGIFTEDGVDYFGFHYYDGATGGTPRYDIDTLLWDGDGWPLLLSEAMKADLTRDQTVDLDDWLRLTQFTHADLSGLPVSGQIARGDLDRDGDNDYDDFVRFKRYYNAIHGDGALAAAIRLSVPEPGTLGMLVLTGAAGLLANRKRHPA